jgi:hypothetical protein
MRFIAQRVECQDRQAIHFFFCLFAIALSITDELRLPSRLSKAICPRVRRILIFTAGFGEGHNNQS